MGVTLSIRPRPRPEDRPRRPGSGGEKWTHLATERRRLLAELVGGTGREADLEVIDPHRDQLAERRGDLFCTGPMDVARNVPPGCPGTEVDGFGHGADVDGRATASLVAPGAQACDLFGKITPTRPLGKPSVAVGGGAPQRRRRRSSDPYGRTGLTHRAGGDPHPASGEAWPRQLGELVGEGAGQCGDGLVCVPSAR